MLRTIPGRRAPQRRHDLGNEIENRLLVRRVPIIAEESQPRPFREWLDPFRGFHDPGAFGDLRRVEIVGNDHRRLDLGIG